MKDAIGELVNSLADDGLEPFARAIMTTDTVPKTASVTGTLSGGPFTIAGSAKGAGMIAPDMATMLAYLMTDVDIDSSLLSELLADVCDGTFNAVTIDGDTSTNDSVIALASGLGPEVSSDEDREAFAAALYSVCESLARQIVEDGEGATRTVEIRAFGAATDEEAEIVARAVAESLLVKTALAAADPNWGRIACAVGYSGVGIEPGSLSLAIGDVKVLAAGEVTAGYDENAAARVMEQESYTIHLHLGGGPGSASVYTSDLTEEYVRINCEYRS
jgi:glutamate N-acetyltransferase/amino-acid N-acetyltransferase